MRPRELLTIMNGLRRAVTGADQPTRMRARAALLQRLAHGWGFEVYGTDLTWLTEAGFWDVWQRAPAWKAHRPDRKFVLYELARSVRHLPGHTAECGVLSGSSSFVICAVLGRDGRRHHAFDSFEGLSAPLAVDAPVQPTSFEWRAGDLAVPLERVRENLSEFDFIDYHAGWIPDRFRDVAAERFAFVHVDVDLYQPTRDSLAFFYERLVPGGVLLCDDYGYATCPGARKAFDELAAGWPEGPPVQLPTGQAFIYKGRP